MVHRATKQRPNQRRYYFLPGTHAISSGEAEIPKKKKTTSGEKNGPDISESAENAAGDLSDGVDMRISELNHTIHPPVTPIEQTHPRSTAK